MDAGKAPHQLDWSGIRQLETDMPFYEIEVPASLGVYVRFELRHPIRVECPRVS